MTHLLFAELSGHYHGNNTEGVESVGGGRDTTPSGLMNPVDGFPGGAGAPNPG
jgi:hypothetical protein